MNTDSGRTGVQRSERSAGALEGRNPGRGSGRTPFTRSAASSDPVLAFAAASEPRASVRSALGPAGELRQESGAGGLLQGMRNSFARLIWPQNRKPHLQLGAPPIEIEVDAPARPSGRMLVIDDHWRIVSVTADAADWIGAPQDDLVGADARERISIPQAVTDAAGFSLATGRSAAVQVPAPQHPGRWVDFHVEPFGGGVKVRFWDVTEGRLRRLRERADAETGQPDLPLADAGGTEIAVLDKAGMIVSANEAWRAAFGAVSVQGRAAGVGAAYLDFCRQAIAGFDEAPLRAGLKDLADAESGGFTDAYRMRTTAGLRWRQVRIMPIRIGGATHLLAIHTDLTEVARAQAALRSGEERLMRAQQEERQRIAIELHDSTSQHLIALGLGIARLRQLVGGPSAHDVLEDLATSVQEAVKEVRVLSYLMKPTAIDREGLETTLRGFVIGFGARTGLHVSFRAEGPVDRASPAVRHAAFRVVQEALANVHRHAGADGAEVELASRAGVLSVRIADDGRGISALRAGQLAPSQIGVGVAGMQERVAKLGGRFEIASDGAGTVVTAQLPADAA